MTRPALTRRFLIRRPLAQVVLLLLLLAAPARAAELKLATWNLEWLTLRPAGDPALRSVDIIYREAERMAEIVRKIGKITRYETKAYVGDRRIVDLDRATGDED